ncbi:MAG: hypothetical protein LIO71_00220, partial [Ruminococcus sp.]|nr:hypothetical protein [Ruminococcus sp.]
LKMSREEHDRYIRDLHDAASFLRTQEIKEEIARKEGREEGKELEKIRMAREMKIDGESIEKISRYTGLTPDQIAEL